MTSYLFAGYIIYCEKYSNVKNRYFEAKIYANVCFLKFYVINLICEVWLKLANH